MIGCRRWDDFTCWISSVHKFQCVEESLANFSHIFKNWLAMSYGFAAENGVPPNLKGLYILVGGFNHLEKY
jgi:hypothetical protein